MESSFTEQDLGVLVAVSEITPELRLCTRILQRAREARLRYPIKTARSLIKLLDGNERVDMEGHCFTPAHIRHYLVHEDFPISEETELAKAVYMGLMRCQADMAWAAQAPPDAHKVLTDFAEAMGPKRRRRHGS